MLGQTILDIEYKNPGTPLSLDLYLPTNPAFHPFPVVVFYHGGGFVGGDKKHIRLGTTEHTMMMLRDAGFAVASVQYRFLDGDNLFPVNITDAKDAIRFLKANASDYDLDPTRIATWGSSAGASLALAAAYLKTDQSPPDVKGDQDLKIFAVVNINAATDLVRSLDVHLLDDEFSQYFREHLNTFCGEENPEMLTRAVSPIHLVSSLSPPTLTMHGVKDNIVDVSESKRLHETLLAKGVSSELYLLPKAGHSLLPVKPEEAEEISRRTVDFLLKHLP